jgi:hypothetical protein
LSGGPFNFCYIILEKWQLAFIPDKEGTVQKFIPTDEQLINMLPHIHYEISQMTETLWAGASILNDLSGSSCPMQLENALWKSCIIHARVLLDFFEFEKRRSRYEKEMDDVLSADYGFQSQKVEIAPHYRDRMNKDLAHFTYSKAYRTFTDSLSPVTKVFLPLLQRCALFCEYLISSNLLEHMPEYLLAWETLQERLNSLVELINQDNS